MKRKKNNGQVKEISSVHLRNPQSNSHNQTQCRGIQFLKRKLTNKVGL